MGKRNKKRRMQEEQQRKQADERAEELAADEQPVAPEPEQPAAETVDVVEVAGADENAAVQGQDAGEAEPAAAEPPAVEPEIEAEPSEEEEKKPPKGFIGTYWMLILGIGFVLMGILSLVLLRTNYIQVYILGYSEPYTGIGHLEAPAQGGNGAFYAIGLILIFVWGMRTEIPEAKPKGAEDSTEEIEAEAAPESEEIPADSEMIEPDEPAEVPAVVAAPVEFGHEHLPPHHLTAVQKIKHLTMAYSQGKISEGLYNENMAKFEAELEGRAAAPAPAEVEEFGHEHLPPHHLSPEEKIDHLTKAFQQGKVSKGLFERDVARFEEELKREQKHMPPHHLSTQEKIDHLEDAYRMGRLSKGTYERNIALFTRELEEEQAKARPPAKAQLDAEIPDEPAADDKTMDQLDSLLEEIEAGNDSEEMREKLRKKKEESFEEKILQEIEDLEDL